MLWCFFFVIKVIKSWGNEKFYMIVVVSCVNISLVVFCDINDVWMDWYNKMFWEVGRLEVKKYVVVSY